VVGNAWVTSPQSSSSFKKFEHQPEYHRKSQKMDQVQLGPFHPFLDTLQPEDLKGTSL